MLERLQVTDKQKKLAIGTAIFGGSLVTFAIIKRSPLGEKIGDILVTKLVRHFGNRYNLKYYNVSWADKSISSETMDKVTELIQETLQQPSAVRWTK